MMIVVVVVGRQRKAGFFIFIFWEGGRYSRPGRPKNKIKNGSPQMIQKDSFFFFFFWFWVEKRTQVVVTL
jgi:hypothetical protein